MVTPSDLLHACMMCPRRADYQPMHAQCTKNDFNHPMNQNMTSFKAYVDIANDLPLTQQQRGKIFDVIIQLAVANKYNRKSVQRMPNSKLKPPKDPTTENGNNKRFQKLPYVGPVRGRIARALNRNLNINLAFKPQKTLESLWTNIKDNIPTGKKSCIYKINTVNVRLIPSARQCGTWKSG